MKYKDQLYMQLDLRTNELVKNELPSFASTYFASLKNVGMSPRTRVQYAYDLKRFFEFIAQSAGFRDLNFKTCTASDILDKLTVADIQEYLDTLEYYTAITKDGKEEIRPSSPAIRARRISSLRSFYRYYFRIGDISSNLADLMDVPKIPDKNIVVMDKSEVSRILSAVMNTDGMTDGELKRHNKIILRDFAIMMLFFGTGIRVSELVGMNLSDVDYYQAALLVTRKGGDEDEVYFGPEVQEALLRYEEECRPALAASNTDEQAFFLSMQHKRISVRNVETMIKAYAEKAGLNKKVTPHALRRTFGTNLYEETGDIYLVADALHHSSVETTKKHYARMSKEHKRTAAQKSSTLFSEE